MRISKKIFCTLFVGIVFSVQAFSKPKYGPQKLPFAIPLSQNPGYFAKTTKTDFWNMISFYVPQGLQSSCGLASLSTVLSAAQSLGLRDSETTNITEKFILEKVQVENLKARMGLEEGQKQKKGLPLDSLEKVAIEAAKKFNLKLDETKVVHAERTLKFKKNLHELLVKNEENPNDFLIVNFNQKLLTDDAEAGHISTVAAFDQQNDQVLILDTDRDYYEPYWVKVDQLIQSMITRDSENSKFRGYLYLKFTN